MKKILISASALLLVCSSCSSISRRNQATEATQESDAQKIERLQSQNKELAQSLTSLSTKLDAVEGKLTSMNEKLEAAQGRIDNVMGNVMDSRRAKLGGIKSVPTEGAAPLPPAGGDDAEAGFTANEAVRKYRQAMILFQSRNYPDATLEFSAFVDQYPDHPLAGSAQYYLGESYFKQKEYKLAARELGRVITTYDRSPHIADTLRDLAISEDKIGQTEEAARHRQLLTSLFPHSPAAHSGTAADEAPETESPATAHSPTHSSESGTTSQATKSSQLDAPPPTAPMAPSGPMEHEAK